MKPDLILLAKIGAPSGIKGEVRVKPYGEADMLDQYGKLESTDGRKFKIKRMRPQKTMMVVKFEGVNSREEAESLNGVKLYLDRKKLPPIEDEDEFYIEELIGMLALDAENQEIGKVINVQNFGAGDLLEISPTSKLDTVPNDIFFIPFTKEIVPELNFEKNTLTLCLPQEVSERDED